MHNNILEWAQQEAWLSSPAQIGAITSLAEAIANGEYKAGQYGRNLRVGDNLSTGTRRVEYTQNGTAIVPISGVIAPKSSMIGLCEDGTSAMALRRVSEALIKDPSVKRVVLMVDSGGGAASGVPEAADALVKLRNAKPVVAAITGIGASAAYWLASAASRIFVEPSAVVGSVGVYSVVSSLSEKLKKDGIDARVIRAGAKKFTPNPIEPLDDDGLALVQANVSRIYDTFVSAVAKNRNISMDEALKLADGTVAQGQEGVERGFADAVMTVDAVVAAADAGEFDAVEEAVSASVAHAVVEKIATNAELATLTDHAAPVVADERAALAAELESLRAQIAATRADVEAATKAAEAARVDALIKDGIVRGAILPAKAEAFRAVAERVGYETLAQIVDGLPDTNMSAAVLAAPDKPTNPLTPNSEYGRKLFAEMGLNKYL